MTRGSTAARFGIPRRFIVVLGLAAACAALVPAAQARRAADLAAPEVFPVCIAMGGQAGPDIAGRVVVWTDNRNGELDIYGRDLRKSSDFPVCTVKRAQDNPSVAAIAVGSRTQYAAVWVDKRNHDGGDIYGRNLTTGERFVVARSGATKWFPEICDSWVAWVEADDAAGPYRVKARDLAARKTYRIATTTVLSTVGLTRRSVGGAPTYTVVYTVSGGDIGGRNLPAGAPFSVSRADRFEWSPDISANRVVWWADGGRIWLKNLKSGTRTLVGAGARPRVDGELVVWDGGGHGGGFVTEYKPRAAVYVRNVARSANVLKITQPHLTCLFPAVSGGTVVWESGPARRVLGHIHIYGADVR